ncbi:uncharacterized protein LOC132831362 isoform X1 [Hemiscyllium ocellatum]|uniref:uncharacterized protein LOC132831362 isoform X1 n=1 Tax=Hemiscyllium ocellatum TaxID=170820 RepID=UPI00296776E4|nr:uncharacterized protein LOC132831362 isoform X1 [Hemiscyllium ocellatum]
MPLSVRILVCLLLYTQQGQGDLRCQIKQEELMIVAVLNERVKITCEYQCQLKHQPANQTSSPPLPVHFTVRLYKDRQEHLVYCASGQAVEPRIRVDWELTVNHTEHSGVYYCTDSTTTTSGTLLQVKHAVHMEKSLTLQYILGTICIILTLYSVAATSVVLVKRKMCARCKTHLVRAADLNPVPQAQKPRNSESQQNARTESAGTATTEDAYMALQKHEVSVYSSLDNDRSKTQASSWRYKASTGAQNIQPQAEEETYESVYESY